MHYTKKDRCLFSYWNGEKNIKADPMSIQRRLMTALPTFETDMKKLGLGRFVAAKLAKMQDHFATIEEAIAEGKDLDLDKVFADGLTPLERQIFAGNLEVTDRILSAVRQAFKVKEMNDEGEGLSDGDLMELYLAFQDYLKSLKKDTPDLLTSPQPTPVASDR